MGRIRFKHIAFILSALLVLPVAYVNCSGPFDFSHSESNMAATSGGDGYSGKAYVVINPGGSCPDGSPYRSQIRFSSSQAFLVRDACADVDPQSINVVLSSIDTNYLAFGTQSFQSDSSIGTVAQAPTLLAAMGMSSSTPVNHVCNGQDCWKFETNGSISSPVDFSTSTDYDFTVLAHADAALGVGATMEVRIDGIASGTQTVSSTTDAEYGVRVTVPAGRHQISIAYTNDYSDASTGADRNLYVSSVRIESVGAVLSTCLARTTGSLLTLTTAQIPYLDKNLAANTRVDSTAVNYSGTDSSPVRLGGGSDSCMAGGSITGGWPLSTPYSTLSSTWAMGIFGQNFLLENFRADNYGDCIGIFDNAAGFVVRGAYCTQTHGDFVSNKNSWGGTIEDSLFDGGVTFFNDKDLLAASPGAVATIRGNLVRLQVFDQTYWGTPGHGWFWKQDTTAPVKLSLHGNVFMAEEAPLTNSQWLDPTSIASCKKADGSPDNVIVWLGAGAYPNQAELDTGCFTLSTNRTDWDQAVAAWKTRHGY